MHHELRLSTVRDGKKYDLYDFFVIPGHRRRKFVIDGYIWPGLHTPAVTGDFPSLKAAQDWFEQATGFRPPRWRKALKLGQNSIAKREAMKKNPRHTLAHLKAEAKNYGMVIRKRDGEYRVAWPKDEASAYYTTDIEDAHDTMQAMVREKSAVKNPMKRHAPKKSAFGKKKAAKLRATPTRDYRGKRSLKSAVAVITARKNPSLGSRVSAYIIRGKHSSGHYYYYTGRSFDSNEKKAAKFHSAQIADDVLRYVEDRLPKDIVWADAVQA